MLAFGVCLSGWRRYGRYPEHGVRRSRQIRTYDCKQLETERKTLTTRSAELQGLMAKADTGLAGPVVAELAYRNEYVSVRGQARFAEEAWQRKQVPSLTTGGPGRGRAGGIAHAAAPGKGAAPLGRGGPLGRFQAKRVPVRVADF